MRILTGTITRKELLDSAVCLMGDDMVKCVADVDKGIIAVDAELHADLEQFLLDNGSSQSDLWGFNLYLTEEDEEDFIEFDSLINIRPSQSNRSRDVEDEAIRQKIREIVAKWVK